MKKDTIIGIGAILVAIFFMFNTGSIKAPADLVDPGPRILPYIAEILMIICGSGIIYESLKDKNKEKNYLSKEGWKKLGFIFILLIAYSIGLSFVGFIFATPFMFAILMQILNSNKFQPCPKVIIIALILTALIYVAFAKGFSVSLPKGSLF
ncbi:MAG: tripartite tricarboxylate transporter TctB family protein [Lachnospirales bacterium]